MSALKLSQRAPARTDHDLVVAVRTGDDRAFEELYSRYGARIRSYVAGMVGDHARAEDLTQEVFIAALRRLGDTERPIAFKPWIYEIAKNACIDEYRRTKRAREVPLADDDSAPERELPSVAPTPDVAVESKQSLAHLQGAFHGLSENHHKIIVMRELEGLSYTQIGERLGMTRPVVESTLFRARRRLTEEYDELASGRRCQHVQQVIDGHDERALRRLGIRERRQLARHLSHCQPCRRHARMAGLDEGLFQTPSVIGKIAALLPFPWLRWRRGGHREDAASAPLSMTASHSFLALRSLQTVMRLADPGSALAAVPRGAAVAAAAVALAGAGGGVVAVVASQPAGHHAASPQAGHVAGASHTTRFVTSTTSGIAPAAPAAPVGLAPVLPAPAQTPRSGGSPTHGSGGSSSTPPSSTPSRTPHHRTPVHGVLSGVTGTAAGAVNTLTGGTVQVPSVPHVAQTLGSALPKVGKVLGLTKLSLPKVNPPQVRLPTVRLPRPKTLIPVGHAPAGASGTGPLQLPSLPTTGLPKLPGLGKLVP